MARRKLTMEESVEEFRKLLMNDVKDGMIVWYKVSTIVDGMKETLKEGGKQDGNGKRY